MAFDFKYPVVSFAKKGYLSFERNENDLLYCTYTGWKNGHYNDLKIVDSAGNRFHIKAASLSDNNNILQKISMFLGAKGRVTLLGDTACDHLSLTDFKEYLLKQLKKNKSFFTAGDNYEEMISYVTHATTIEDIISYLTTLFYKTY